MLTALKLSVLAARVVVTERQDFTSHLTGINRQDIFFWNINSVYDLLSSFSQAGAGRVGQAEGQLQGGGGPLQGREEGGHQLGEGGDGGGETHR